MDFDKQLYNIIDKILWEDWDPIGVNNCPEARNEYHGYIPEIFSLILNNVPAEKISSKLYSFATERMGLSNNKNNCLVVANKIISEKAKLTL